jgi:hypothetical protein
MTQENGSCGAIVTTIGNGTYIRLDETPKGGHNPIEDVLRELDDFQQKNPELEMVSFVPSERKGVIWGVWILHKPKNGKQLNLPRPDISSPHDFGGDAG